MTTITAYVDQHARELRSSPGGSTFLTIKHTQGTWLALKLAFCKGGKIQALTDDTPVSMVIKPVDAPESEPIALDVTADETGAGEARRYLLKALIDGAALRTLLAGKDSAEFSLQIAWGTPGEEDYEETFPLKITIVTSYFREGDAVPEPLTDAGWEKIKAFFPEAGLITYDEETKTIAITAASVAWSNVTGKPSTFPPESHTQAISTITGLQTALDGKAASSHTHAIANVTGLQTALDAKEAALGNPDANGKVLASTAAGVRTWVTPASATPLKRFTATLQGYTTTASEATSPAPIVFTLALGVYAINGTTYTVATEDPADSTVWIDASSGLASAGAALQSLLGSPCSFNTGTNEMTVATNSTGASACISVNSTEECGTDAVAASGEISSVALHTVASGKKLRYVNAFVKPSSSLDAALHVLSDPIVMASASGNGRNTFLPEEGVDYEMGAGDDLVVVISGDVPVGGSAEVLIIMEEVNA